MERVEWEVAREIACDGITVRLKMLPLRSPKFSVEVGSGTGAEFRLRIPIEPDGSLTAEVECGLLNL